MTPLLYTDGPRLGKLVFALKPYNLLGLATIRRPLLAQETELIFHSPITTFPSRVSGWVIVSYAHHQSLRMVLTS